MRYYYQIYTGGAEGRGVSFDAILAKLPPADSIRALIVGWSEDMALYRALRSFTINNGIELWLWFPVFSEHSKQAHFRRQQSITGNSFAPKLFDGDEEFDFCCPTDKALIPNLLGIFDEKYASVGFDGVFLDRIRYQTMTSGLDAIFGCRCKECSTWFEQRGLSRKDVRLCHDRITQKLQDESCVDPLGIRSYRNGRYELEDPVLERMLWLKARMITEVAEELAAEFRARGLKIGMDLFTPFIAHWVGQDYASLIEIADFIKPMLYRNTYTPAGYGFELDAMCAAAEGRNEETNAQRRAYIYELFSAKGDLTELFTNEVEAVKRFECAAKRIGKIIPGIEIHTVKENPPIAAEAIDHSIQLLRSSDYHSRVACWDVLQADREQMEAFIREE